MKNPQKSKRKVIQKPESKIALARQMALVTKQSNINMKNPQKSKKNVIEKPESKIALANPSRLTILMPEEMRARMLGQEANRLYTSYIPNETSKETPKVGSTPVYYPLANKEETEVTAGVSLTSQNTPTNTASGLKVFPIDRNMISNASFTPKNYQVKGYLGISPHHHKNLTPEFKVVKSNTDKYYIVVPKEAEFEDVLSSMFSEKNAGSSHSKKNAGSSHISKGRNIPISVLTYNVSHEAIGGKTNRHHSAHVLGGKCLNTSHNALGHNQCFFNMVYICSHAPHTFVGLQEVDRNIDEVIQTVLQDKHKQKFNIISTRFLSLLYNANIYETIGKPYISQVIQSNGRKAPGRPIIAQLFKHIRGSVPIAVINMHCPHKEYSLRENITHAINKLSNTQVKRVIVMGDFNKEHMYPFEIPPLSFQPAISKSNYQKTGWNLLGEGSASNKLKYNKAVDNVIIAGGNAFEAETWNIPGNMRKLLPSGKSPITGKRFPTLTSDHSPVATQVVFTHHRPIATVAKATLHRAKHQRPHLRMDPGSYRPRAPALRHPLHWTSRAHRRYPFKHDQSNPSR